MKAVTPARGIPLIATVFSVGVLSDWSWRWCSQRFSAWAGCASGIICNRTNGPTMPK